MQSFNQFRTLILAGLLGVVPTVALGQSLDVEVGLGGVSADISVDLGNGGAEVLPGPSTTHVAPSTLSETATALGQDAARQAVANANALPLETVLSAAQSEVEGQVIDSELISVRNFLLYRFRVVAPNGRVSDVYYYANSGLKVRSD